MANSQGSRSNLRIIEETTFGVTPTTPTLSKIPVNTHSLSLSKSRVQSGEIRSDRLVNVDRHGNRTVGGSIETEFRGTDFDALLESAMFSTWDATPVSLPDELKVGVTPKFFTIEDAAEDISQYRIFRGCGVSTMSISLQLDQMVSANFDIVGKDMEQAQTTVSTGGAPTDYVSTQPFDTYSGTLKEGGSTIAYLTGLDFSVSNSLAPTYALGTDVSGELEYGMAVVEGTITAYYTDEVLIQKFLDEVESSLEVTITDPTNSTPYTFIFPRVKYNGADVPLQGTGSRFITLPFVALRDDTTETNLIIKRPDSNP